MSETMATPMAITTCCCSPAGGVTSVKMAGRGDRTSGAMSSATIIIRIGFLSLGLTGLLVLGGPPLFLPSASAFQRKSRQKTQQTLIAATSSANSAQISALPLNSDHQSFSNNLSNNASTLPQIGNANSIESKSITTANPVDRTRMINDQAHMFETSNGVVGVNTKFKQPQVAKQKPQKPETKTSSSKNLNGSLNVGGEVGGGGPGGQSQGHLTESPSFKVKKKLKKKWREDSISLNENGNHQTERVGVMSPLGVLGSQNDVGGYRMGNHNHDDHVDVFSERNHNPNLNHVRYGSMSQNHQVTGQNIQRHGFSSPQNHRLQQRLNVNEQNANGFKNDAHFAGNSRFVGQQFAINQMQIGNQMQTTQIRIGDEVQNTEENLHGNIGNLDSLTPTRDADGNYNLPPMQRGYNQGQRLQTQSLSQTSQTLTQEQLRDIRFNGGKYSSTRASGGNRGGNQLGNQSGSRNSGHSNTNIGGDKNKIMVDLSVQGNQNVNGNDLQNVQQNAKQSNLAGLLVEKLQSEGRNHNYGTANLNMNHVRSNYDQQSNHLSIHFNQPMTTHPMSQPHEVAHHQGIGNGISNFNGDEHHEPHHDIVDITSRNGEGSDLSVTKKSDISLNNTFLNVLKKKAVKVRKTTMPTGMTPLTPASQHNLNTQMSPTHYRPNSNTPISPTHNYHCYQHPFEQATTPNQNQSTPSQNQDLSRPDFDQMPLAIHLDDELSMVSGGRDSGSHAGKMTAGGGYDGRKMNQGGLSYFDKGNKFNLSLKTQKNAGVPLAGHSDNQSVSVKSGNVRQGSKKQKTVGKSVSNIDPNKIVVLNPRQIQYHNVNDQQSQYNNGQHPVNSANSPLFPAINEEYHNIPQVAHQNQNQPVRFENQEMQDDEDNAHFKQDDTTTINTVAKPQKKAASKATAAKATNVPRKNRLPVELEEGPNAFASLPASRQSVERLKQAQAKKNRLYSRDFGREDQKVKQKSSTGTDTVIRRQKSNPRSSKFGQNTGSREGSRMKSRHNSPVEDRSNAELSADQMSKVKAVNSDPNYTESPDRRQNAHASGKSMNTPNMDSSAYAKSQFDSTNLAHDIRGTVQSQAQIQETQMPSKPADRHNRKRFSQGQPFDSRNHQEYLSGGSGAAGSSSVRSTTNKNPKGTKIEQQKQNVNDNLSPTKKQTHSTKRKRPVANSMPTSLQPSIDPDGHAHLKAPPASIVEDYDLLDSRHVSNEFSPAELQENQIGGNGKQQITCAFHEGLQGSKQVDPEAFTKQPHQKKKVASKTQQRKQVRFDVAESRTDITDPSELNTEYVHLPEMKLFNKRNPNLQTQITSFSMTPQAMSGQQYSGHYNSQYTGMPRTGNQQSAKRAEEFTSNFYNYFKPQGPCDELDMVLGRGGKNKVDYRVAQVGANQGSTHGTSNLGSNQMSDHLNKIKKLEQVKGQIHKLADKLQRVEITKKEARPINIVVEDSHPIIGGPIIGGASHEVAMGIGSMGIGYAGSPKNRSREQEIQIIQQQCQLQRTDAPNGHLNINIIANNINKILGSQGSDRHLVEKQNVNLNTDKWTVKASGNASSGSGNSSPKNTVNGKNTFSGSFKATKSTSNGTGNGKSGKQDFLTQIQKYQKEQNKHSVVAAQNLSSQNQNQSSKGSQKTQQKSQKVHPTVQNEPRRQNQQNQRIEKHIQQFKELNQEVNETIHHQRGNHKTKVVKNPMFEPKIMDGMNNSLMVQGGPPEKAENQVNLPVVIPQQTVKYADNQNQDAQNQDTTANPNTNPFGTFQRTGGFQGTFQGTSTFGSKPQQQLESPQFKSPQFGAHSNLNVSNASGSSHGVSSQQNSQNSNQGRNYHSPQFKSPGSPTKTGPGSPEFKQRLDESLGKIQLESPSQYKQNGGDNNPLFDWSRSQSFGKNSNLLSPNNLTPGQKLSPGQLSPNQRPTPSFPVNETGRFNNGSGNHLSRGLGLFSPNILPANKNVPTTNVNQSPLVQSNETSPPGTPHMAPKINSQNLQPQDNGNSSPPNNTPVSQLERSRNSSRNGSRNHSSEGESNRAEKTNPTRDTKLDFTFNNFTQ